MSRDTILMVAFVVVFLFACWLDHRKVSRETDPEIRRRNFEGRWRFLTFLMFIFYLVLGFVLKFRND